MSVYNRPLFRQMGGPAQPMPQDMAPPAQQLPPEAAMLQQVEQASAAQGQELGKAYAEQMMQGIDAAQSAEELINAFRGNERHWKPAVMNWPIMSDKGTRTRRQSLYWPWFSRSL